MTFSVNDMLSQLQYGGVRSNLFQVTFTNPANSSGDAKLPFMCEASSIPGFQTGMIPVPYFGRTIKLPGDRVWNGWSVTVINDEDFIIKNAIEQWSNQINSFEGNLRTFPGPQPALLKSTASVIQYGKTGNVLRTYLLHGIFPTVIQDIGLDWSPNDSLQSFNVQFEFDWAEVDPSSITGNAGGN